MKNIIRAGLALIATMLAPTPAAAKWLRADTENFIIYSEGSEKSLRDFAEVLQRFDATLRLRFKIPGGQEPNRLTIFLVPRATDAGRLASGKSNSSIAGFYSADFEGSYAVSHRENIKLDRGTSHAQQVLFHEYGHHFMKRYLSAAFPAWFIEGFAEYYSTTDYTKEGHSKIGMPAYFRAYGLLNLPKLPAETLLLQRPGELRKSGQAEVYYGRAWLLTHMLYYYPERAGQLTTYMEAINRGEDGKKAATDAFGDLAVLDKDLNRYMTRPLAYRQAVDPIPVPGTITIAALSPAEDAVLPLHLERRSASDDEQRTETRDALKKLSLIHSSDAGVWFELAAAEWEMNEAKRDLTAVRAALDRAIALRPKHVRANLLLGQWMLAALDDKADATAADWNAARKPVILANRADPDDPLPLFVYFDSFRQEGARPPSIAVDGLGRAFDLGRENARIRISYAFALANQGNFDAAEGLAKAIAFDPHDNGEGEELLNRLEAMRKERAGKNEDTDKEEGKPAGS